MKSDADIHMFVILSNIAIENGLTLISVIDGSFRLEDTYVSLSPALKSAWYVIIDKASQGNTVTIPESNLFLKLEDGVICCRNQGAITIADMVKFNQFAAIAKEQKFQTDLIISKYKESLLEDFNIESKANTTPVGEELMKVTLKKIVVDKQEVTLDGTNVLVKLNDDGIINVSNNTNSSIFKSLLSEANNACANLKFIDRKHTGCEPKNFSGNDYATLLTQVCYENECLKIEAVDLILQKNDETIECFSGNKTLDKLAELKANLSIYMNILTHTMHPSMADLQPDPTDSFESDISGKTSELNVMDQPD
jgi:hypothetical protein